MNLTFTLVIIITSLTTGQSIKERSKIKYPTMHQCSQAGQYISSLEKYSDQYGFAFKITWECK